MGFVLKKIVSGFLQPSSLVLYLLFLGIMMSFFRRRRRASLVLLIASLSLGVLSVFSWIPNAVLGRLEQKFTPYESTKPDPQWILVLGQGFSAEAGVPDSSRVNATMHARLAEALRIMRGSESMTMLVSIAGLESIEEKEVWWAFWCESVNLPQERTLIIADAKDTWDELNAALEHMGQEPFVLVSSASHLPRAVRMAVRLGACPIPAPCDYKALQPQNRYGFFIPSSRNTARLEQALDEYVGMVWDNLVNSN